MSSMRSPSLSSSEDEGEEYHSASEFLDLYSSEEESEDDMARGGSRSATHRLTPLRTKAEVEKSGEMIDVYVCEVPVKATGEIIEALKTVNGQQNLLLQHVRRVAKRNHRPDFLTAKSCTTEERLWIILCPVSMLPLEDLTLLLSGTSTFGEAAAPVLSIPIPKHPPLSAKHANQLTRKYWPTIYTSTNPFGPHPTVTAKKTAAMERNGNASKWMRLAHDVARHSSTTGKGLAIGTVVVERLPNGDEQVVCVAGDHRHASRIQPGSNGNPAAHSVMRAITMVADKRLAKAGLSEALRKPAIEVPAFQGSLSPFEARFFTNANVPSPNGYLCLDLLVYTTHEPCLMCSMALVHSRVGGLVFRRAMKETGGMLAERVTRRQCGHDKWHKTTPKPSADGNGLTYGTFYREDLNWRFQAWQWDSTQGMFEFDKSAKIPNDLHA